MADLAVYVFVEKNGIETVNHASASRTRQYGTRLGKTTSRTSGVALIANDFSIEGVASTRCPSLKHLLSDWH